MTKKDLKLLKKTSNNRIFIYMDYAFLIMIWLSTIGTRIHLGGLTEDERWVSISLTVIFVLDIFHRKRELRLIDLLKRNLRDDGTWEKETSEGKV